MGWFWKKKPATPAEAVGAHVVAAAMAQSHRTDREWRELQAQQQREEKRREQEIERAAKEATKEMKKQVKAAEKERKRAEKQFRKQAKTMRRLQKRELKQEKKAAKKHAKTVKVQAKKAKRARHEEDKRRKRIVRQRKKEERKRRKQNKAVDAQQVKAAELERQRVEAEREAERLRAAVAGVSTPSQPDVIDLREAPKFKESLSCKSCSTKFKRLPTYRRHHCRNCGESFCGQCLSATKRPIPWFKMDKPQKVCFTCDVQVFNGMGGADKKKKTKKSEQETVPEPVAAVPTVPVVSEARDHAPLQRSDSSRSEQPEDDDSPRSSKGSRRFISLRPRSRRDQSSSKSKKNSLWTLPIRPLLKRKASADQLRNRAWDLDLLVEKEAMLARQRQSQAVVTVTAPPRLAPAV